MVIRLVNESHSSKSESSLSNGRWEAARICKCKPVDKHLNCNHMTASGAAIITSRIGCNFFESIVALNSH